MRCSRISGGGKELAPGQSTCSKTRQGSSFPMRADSRRAAICQNDGCPWVAIAWTPQGPSPAPTEKRVINWAWLPHWPPASCSVLFCLETLHPYPQEHFSRVRAELGCGVQTEVPPLPSTSGCAFLTPSGRRHPRPWHAQALPCMLPAVLLIGLRQELQAEPLPGTFRLWQEARNQVLRWEPLSCWA